MDVQGAPLEKWTQACLTHTLSDLPLLNAPSHLTTPLAVILVLVNALLTHVA